LKKISNMVDLATIGAMCELEYRQVCTWQPTTKTRERYRMERIGSFDELKSAASGKKKLIEQLRPNSPVNEHTKEFKRTNAEHKKYGGIVVREVWQEHGGYWRENEPENVKKENWCIVQ